MANEYRIYSVNTEAIHEGDPLGVMRFYAVNTEVIHEGVALAQINIYQVGVEVVRTLADLYSPAFVSEDDEVFEDFKYRSPFTWAPIGVGDDEVHPGFYFYPEKFTISDRERNPYPSHIIDDESFFKEQQRTLRDQHNLTQAGDSTFDYGLLLKGTPKKLYTLGSLGRFYHDRFGLILARYVEFQSCVETTLQGAPVGYLSTSKNVDWVVTNDITKSSPDQAMGVMCLAEVPADGTFGWIVTEGPVPVAVNQTLGIHPAPETPYGWSTTGALDVDVVGRVVARRWGRALGPPIEAGGVYVRLEAMSPQWFSEWLEDQLAPINAAITALDARLDTAETNLDNLTATSVLHTGQIAALDVKINKESAKRAADIAAIRLEIGAVDWSSTIIAGDNAVRDEFRVADEALQIQISAVKFTADAAYAIVSGLDVGGINLRLDGLDAQIADLYVRLENFTVVNPTPTAGTVLMQMLSGGVYTFEPVDFILENLADVDTTTTPPSDGDVLTWDSGDSLWKPEAPTGGGSGSIIDLGCPVSNWSNSGGGQASKGVIIRPLKTIQLDSVFAHLFSKTIGRQYQAIVATVSGTSTVGTVLDTTNPYTAASTAADIIEMSFASSVTLTAGTLYMIVVSHLGVAATTALPIGTLASTESCTWPSFGGYSNAPGCGFVSYTAANPPVSGNTAAGSGVGSYAIGFKYHE